MLYVSAHAAYLHEPVGVVDSVPVSFLPHAAPALGLVVDLFSVFGVVPFSVVDKLLAGSSAPLTLSSLCSQVTSSATRTLKDGASTFKAVNLEVEPGHPELFQNLQCSQSRGGHLTRSPKTFSKASKQLISRWALDPVTQNVFKTFNKVNVDVDTYPVIQNFFKTFEAVNLEVDTCPGHPKLFQNLQSS